MSVDPLMRLAGWYASNTDGGWEHEYGVRIETLDNPGWSVTIDLADTDVADRPFERIERDAAESWLVCWKDDATTQFRAACDPASLGAAIEAFLAWAEHFDAAATDTSNHRAIGPFTTLRSSYTSDAEFVDTASGTELHWQFEHAGSLMRGGLRFERARAYRYRAEGHSASWYVQAACDRLVEVEDSAWVAELLAAQPPDQRHLWDMHHFLIYVSDHGAFEVVADAVEWLPESPVALADMAAVAPLDYGCAGTAGLEHVYLEDSWVRDVCVSPTDVRFQLELVLTREHPCYSPDHPGQQHRYAAAGLGLTGATSVTWNRRPAQPNRDPTVRPTTAISTRSAARRVVPCWSATSARSNSSATSR